YLPNGVDFHHFAAQRFPPPPEYSRLPGPIAIYVGVLPPWFHFEWIREAAGRLPAMSFVLVGPDSLAREEFRRVKNVHVLGVRDHSLVPAYLQHAQVGLVPFDPDRNPRGVEVLNPQKLYAYFACGLPVVCSEWKEIRDMHTPARVCSSVDEFID